MSDNRQLQVIQVGDNQQGLGGLAVFVISGVSGFLLRPLGFAGFTVAG
jgi:hypothetical protein